jgi:hypothetical protein
MAKSNLIQRHPFQLVDQSPWPFLAGMSSLTLTTGFVMYMHCYQGGFMVFSFGFLSLLFTFFVWWRDIVREGTFQGHHTKAVQDGLTWGMILFITSEVMFFFAFFLGFLCCLFITYN